MIAGVLDHFSSMAFPQPSGNCSREFACASGLPPRTPPGKIPAPFFVTKKGRSGGSPSGRARDWSRFGRSPKSGWPDGRGAAFSAIAFPAEKPRCVPHRRSTQTTPARTPAKLTLFIRAVLRRYPRAPPRAYLRHIPPRTLERAPELEASVAVGAYRIDQAISCHGGCLPAARGLRSGGIAPFNSRPIGCGGRMVASTVRQGGPSPS